MRSSRKRLGRSFRFTSRTDKRWNTGNPYSRSNPRRKNSVSFERLARAPGVGDQKAEPPVSEKPADRTGNSAGKQGPALVVAVSRAPREVGNEAGMCLGINDLTNSAPIAHWVGPPICGRRNA